MFNTVQMDITNYQNYHPKIKHVHKRPVSVKSVLLIQVDYWGKMASMLNFLQFHEYQLLKKASCFWWWNMYASIMHPNIVTFLLDDELIRIWAKIEGNGAQISLLVSLLWILNADCSNLTRLAHFKPMWSRIYMVIAIQRGMCPLWRAPIILILICIGTVRTF